MPRAKQAICAGALVLSLVAGCTLPDAFRLSYLQSSGPGGDQVVAGSLESVSLSTQATLQRLGMMAVVTNEGGILRIRSQTPTGNRFALVLTRAQNSQGEQTQVHIEWEGKSDEQTGSQILGQINLQSKQAGSGAQK